MNDNSLANARTKRGITQQEMATYLNIAVSTYNQYEKGMRRIPADKVEAISKILNLNKKTFFIPSLFTLSKQNNAI